MEIYSIIGSVLTAVSFVVFIGIVMWAYSSRRTQDFAQAANEPFALPDEDLVSVAARARGAAQ